MNPPLNMLRLSSQTTRHFAALPGIACACALLCSGQLMAATNRIHVKIGTLLPRGTEQFFALEKMGQSWAKESSGGVKLTIFPDGSLGDETTMVRQLQNRAIQAGLFSVKGLAEIDDGVAGLQYMPLTFRSWEEVDWVRKQMDADLKQRFERKGYVLLFWADMGWVRFFSREPLVRPSDFQRASLFVWAGDTFQFDLMKQLGYRPVALDVTDLRTAVSTGTVDAFPLPPLMVLRSQLTRAARHMVDMKWVPIVGAAVIRRDTWSQIPPDLQQRFLDHAETAGREIRQRSRGDDSAHIAELERTGLQIHKLSAAQEAEWKTLAASVAPIRGKMVPAEIFDAVERHLNDLRTKAPLDSASTPK